MGWRFALDQEVEIIKVIGTRSFLPLPMMELGTRSFLPLPMMELGTRSFLPLPMIEFGYYFFFVCKAQAIIYILYILSTRSHDTGLC